MEEVLSATGTCVSDSSSPSSVGAYLDTTLRDQRSIMVQLQSQSEVQNRILDLLKGMLADGCITGAFVPAPDGRAESYLDVPAPEWDGSESGLEPFIDQCELNFEANPSLFPTDQRKILFAIGHMTGPPRRHLRIVRQSGQSPPYLHSWPKFCKKLRRSYGDPDPEYTARLHSLTLLQTTTFG